MKYPKLFLFLAALLVILMGNESFKRKTSKKTRFADSEYILEQIIKEKIKTPKKGHEFLSPNSFDLLIPLALKKGAYEGEFAHELERAYLEAFKKSPDKTHPLIASLLENSEEEFEDFPLEEVSQEKTAEELKEMGFSVDQLDALAITYVEACPNSFICLIAPRGFAHEDKIKTLISLFGEVVYTKAINLNSPARKNLLLHTYSYLCDFPHQWVQNPKKVQKHLQARYTENAPSLAILFTAKNVNVAKACKMALRKHLRLKTTGVHITDTQEEALKLSQVLFHNPTLKALGNMQESIPDGLKVAMEEAKRNLNKEPDEKAGFSKETAETIFEGKPLPSYPLISDPKFLDPNAYFYYRGVKVLLPVRESD